jgi:hypothetical protein
VALQTKQLVTGEWSFPVTERAAPGDLALELAEQGFRGASAWLPVGECIHHEGLCSAHRWVLQGSSRGVDDVGGPWALLRGEGRGGGEKITAHRRQME